MQDFMFRKIKIFFQAYPEQKDERAQKQSKIFSLGKILRPQNSLAWLVQTHY